MWLTAMTVMYDGYRNRGVRRKTAVHCFFLQPCNQVVIFLLNGSSFRKFISFSVRSSLLISVNTNSEKWKIRYYGLH